MFWGVRASATKTSLFPTPREVAKSLQLKHPPQFYGEMEATCPKETIPKSGLGCEMLVHPMVIRDKLKGACNPVDF